jgi:hypothetical protein
MTTEMTDSSIQGQRTLTSVVTFVKFDLQEQIPFPDGVLSINWSGKEATAAFIAFFRMSRVSGGKVFHWPC